MLLNCTFTAPWAGEDFTPCFRETVIDGLLPLIILASSLIAIVSVFARYRRSCIAVYAPLKDPSSRYSGYGATNDTLPTTTQDSIQAEQDELGDDLSSNGSTLTPGYDELPARWTVYSFARLLAVVPFALYIYAIHQLLSGTYELDGAVESSYTYMLFVHGLHAALWGFALILAFANFLLPETAKPVADEICKQLNIWYFVFLLIGFADLYSFYVAHYLEHIGTGYRISLVSNAVALGIICIIALETRHAPVEPVTTEDGRIVSGEKWASLYSKFMFNWVESMMKEGYKRTLNDEDLLELPPENRTKNTLAFYRKQKAKSIKISLFKTFKGPLILQAAYSLIWNLGMFGPPLFLNLVIKYIENREPENREPVSSAYLYVFGLFITSLVQSLAVQQSLYIGRCIGIRIQSIIIGEVFDKALRRRDVSSAATEEDSEKGKTKGNVNNLLSVDAQKLGEMAAYFFYFYSYPIQIAISIWLLYELLGTAALWGVLAMFLAQPVPAFLSMRYQKVHQKVMSATDKRIKTVNELLGAIRIVKFFAWEKEFRKRVTEARTEELKAIRGRLFMFLYMMCCWFLIPVFIMVVVFYTYTRNHELTASTAFTAVALFNTFRAALDELPLLLTWLLQANVATKRIDGFLAEDEVEQPPSATGPDAPFIGFVDNATFAWEKSVYQERDLDKANLKNLNLSFPRNKLSIVCGPTGSGKTTLIASLLGETYCMSGAVCLPRKTPSRNGPLGGSPSGIAYVAQSAWLQNCSIRDNILFGLPFDAERYEKVIYMTALTRDLEILEYGDSTEVGEKGVTLSGGQKQRVAIARAVYSQAETVILDDCLSAVDAHTAKHLYEHCLTGELMRDRTVILVTHHVGLCIKGSSYVVALKDGEVAAAGDPLSVLKSGVLGEELARASEETANEEEMAATEGPIPVVPKTVKAPKQSGAGKLTEEEARAEGSVTWSVYDTYIRSSGGYLYWVLILLIFCAAQGTVIGQDYWIKVWASAYGDAHKDNASMSAAGVFSISRVASALEPSTITLKYIGPTIVTGANGKEVNIEFYLGVYVLIGVVALIMTFLRSFTMYVGSLKASRRLHQELLERMLRAKVRFFDRTPIGRIVNRFSSDMETIDQAVAPQMSFLVYSIVATLFVILLISWVVPLFMLPGAGIALLYWLIGTYYLATSRDMKRLNSVSRSPIYVQFSESMNGVVTIRAFGSQFRFLAENYKKIDNNNRPFIWMWATNRWLHCRVESLGAFVSFCTGFVLVLSRNWVDAGLAGLALSYSLTFTHHVLWVVRCYAMNEMNMNAIERVSEYLDIEEEAPVHIPATCPPPSWPETGSVKVEDLVMRYSPEMPAVLRKISFETRPREKIGIVGRTGSGKSTLALSLFRFMEASGGRILIDGVDISSIGLEDLRSRLTIIPQDPVLFSGTLRTNLDPFDQYDDADLWAAIKRSHLVDDENSNITLDTPVLENGSNWSQGQRQLIALARALVKKSSLIILDEATSSVDFDTDHQIQQTIRSEFNNSSLLCIAHRIRTVIDYDRILVLDHGEIKEFDTPYNLITKEDGVFHQMCERSGEYAELLAVATAKHNE